MSNLPKHVAIIMDGNGRWAQAKKLPRIAGHRTGVRAVEQAIEFTAKKGIDVLTLFAFGLDNNNRPITEIKYLMSLFLDALKRHTKKLHDHDIRIRVIGDRNYLSKKLLAQVEQTEQLTADNSGMTLVLAINYSGQWDIAQATKQIAQQVADGALEVSAINEDLLQSHVCLAEFPAPDLLIRTSGEQRISNFMLWQFAYTELFFTPVYWPDFDKNIYQQALDCFQARQRRFGLTGNQLLE